MPSRSSGSARRRGPAPGEAQPFQIFSSVPGAAGLYEKEKAGDYAPAFVFDFYSIFSCCFSPAASALKKLMCAASAASFNQLGMVQFFRTARISFAR